MSRVPARLQVSEIPSQPFEASGLRAGGGHFLGRRDPSSRVPGLNSVHNADSRHQPCTRASVCDRLSARIFRGGAGDLCKKKIGKTVVFSLHIR
jgi:hypothetical protein